PLALAEYPQHVGGYGDGILLLHATHDHAKVARLNDDADSLRLYLVHDGLGNLHGQALLHLQPPRKDIDDAGNLAEANHLAVGNVSDVATPEKREEVMFAHAEDFDVSHH